MADRLSPAGNAGVPPSTRPSFSTLMLCASVPLLSSLRRSVPAPRSTIVEGSNEYSFAVTRTLPPGGRGHGAAGPIVPAAARGEQPDGREGEGGAGQGERILCRAVTRPIAIGGLLAAILLAGCGGEIKVPESDQTAHRGAELFHERCSGCHTFTQANAYGSKPTGQLQGGERTNGPNFDVRHVAREDALFAIRNGGFSGAIMPANVVTGRQAEEVADFLDKYSGKSN